MDVVLETLRKLIFRLIFNVFSKLLLGSNIFLHNEVLRQFSNLRGNFFFKVSNKVNRVTSTQVAVLYRYLTKMNHYENEMIQLTSENKLILEMHK